ncbi:MAG: ABC transporter substrate-binding protein [Candidatus Howiella sp.]
MKKSRRVLALVLTALMMVGCFAACGDQAGDTEANTLVIGGIGPLTGGAASYGQGVMKGAQLAVDEINAAGGVNGMTLSLNFQDDEHTTDKAVNAYNSLKDKGMKLLMGTVTSNPCVAVAEKTYADNMFQLTPSGSSVACTQYDNAFRICFNDPNQGTVSAQYIAENNIASKIAIIYDSSDVYSSGIKDKFVTEAANRNLEIVATEAFTSDSKTDFSVQLQKIQASGAELVFLPIYYSEAAMILSQANKSGLDVKWFGCDGLDGLIAQLGDEVALADGVMLLTPFVADAQDEKTVAFVSAYKAANNDEIPNQFAADAYDAIYTIKAALEKAGVKDASISASDLCDLLVPVMTQIEVVGVTGTMTWDATGEPTKEPKGMKIANGAYTAM